MTFRPVGIRELKLWVVALRRQVKIHRRPIVAVLSTGNELVSIQDTSSKPTSSFSSIPDSNRPSLLAILQNLHFETLDLGIIGDTMEETTKALKRGKEEADIIISTGGTSMGVGDLLKPCIERELKGTVHFGRVAMKPGYVPFLHVLACHPKAKYSDLSDRFFVPLGFCAPQKADHIRYSSGPPHGAESSSPSRIRPAREPSERSRDIFRVRATCPAEDGRTPRIGVGASTPSSSGASRIARLFSKRHVIPSLSAPCRSQAPFTSTPGRNTTASGSALPPRERASHSKRSRRAVSGRVGRSASRAPMAS